MKCNITIKGFPGARHGRPCRDRTEPVENFLVDNSYFYSKVKQHVEKCNKCDPVAILEVYLNRRKREKRFHEMTSSSLATLAIQYENMMKKKNQIPPIKLINEFIWRSGSERVLLRNERRLSIPEKFNALKVIYESPRAGGRFSDYVPNTLIKESKMFSVLWTLVKCHTGAPESEEEIQSLLKVADVMLS